MNESTVDVFGRIVLLCYCVIVLLFDVRCDDGLFCHVNERVSLVEGIMAF
jgi:hypothetical protein